MKQKLFTIQFETRRKKGNVLIVDGSKEYLVIGDKCFGEIDFAAIESITVNGKRFTYYKRKGK